MEPRAASRSDRGRVREENEDAVLEDLPLAAVADGIGGHRGGEVAAQLALETLSGWRDRLTGKKGAEAGAVLREAFNHANRAVWERAQQDPDVAGMGTTLTAVWLTGDVATLAHVGDSRAYLLRGATLQQLTEDQTVAQEWVRQGRLSAEEAAESRQRHVLLQSIGTAPDELEIELSSFELRPGDRLLLSSDGLYGMLTEDALRDTLSRHQDPDRACDELVAAANAAGGSDNISAVIVAVPGEPVAPDETGPIITTELAEPTPPRRTRLLVGAGAAAVLILAGLGWLLMAGRSDYVVTARHGTIVLLEGTQGVGGKAATGEVVWVYRQESLSSFPDTTQRDLRSGIAVSSQEEADRVVSSLPRQLGPQDTPHPSPIPDAATVGGTPDAGETP